ncbi:UNVERIFIED_CONTAM: transmembrane protein, putative [Hammondia hammondi]|eukprot:XP_008884544.1 transmembrane protein, putative [Hammondia hammondi]
MEYEAYLFANIAGVVALLLIFFFHCVADQRPACSREREETCRLSAGEAWQVSTLGRKPGEETRRRSIGVELRPLPPVPWKPSFSRRVCPALLLRPLFAVAASFRLLLTFERHL